MHCYKESVLQITLSHNNPYCWDNSSLVTNTQVTMITLEDENNDDVNITHSAVWMEVTLNNQGSVTETRVNMSSETQPVHSFVVQHASALFFGIRYIVPPDDDDYCKYFDYC